MYCVSIIIMWTVINAPCSILGAAHLALALVNHKDLNVKQTGTYVAQKPTDSTKVGQQLDDQ